MSHCRSISLAVPLLISGLLAASHAEEHFSLEKPVGILLAAGDIARCQARRAKDEATAKLIGKEINEAERSGIPVRILALGDLAYSRGTTKEFKCFDDSWGQYKKYMLPVPGNHEYLSKPEKPGANPDRHAKPYFEYFNDNALLSQNGPESGYYSLNFPDEKDGPWHLIGLNAYVGIDDGSPQIAWLEDDLKETRARCILTFTHPYVFSSGRHGHNNVEKPNAALKRAGRIVDAYRILYAHNASILLSAHEHAYEQFSRQDEDGNKVDNGIRSFVVGTGGARLYNQIDYDTREENSEKYWQDSHGILRIELFPGHYRWDFVPIEGDEDIALPVSEDRCNDRP